METYKGSLLIKMNELQRKLDFNRKSLYFLVTQNCHDHVFLDPREDNGKLVDGECKKLVLNLLNWPQRLNNFMDVMDERHADQRQVIEK